MFFEEMKEFCKLFFLTKLLNFETAACLSLNSLVD